MSLRLLRRRASQLRVRPARRGALPRPRVRPAARPDRDPPAVKYRARAVQGAASRARRSGRAWTGRGRTSATASRTAPASANAHMTARDIRTFCHVSDGADALSGPRSRASRCRRWRITAFSRSPVRSRRPGRRGRATAQTRERGDSVSQFGPARAGVARPPALGVA